MADSYLGRLQSMFSAPYTQGGGRPVSGPLTPMQQAALAGPGAPRPVSGPLTPMQQAALAGPQRTPLNITPRPGMAQAGRIAPGMGWPTPVATPPATPAAPAAPAPAAAGRGLLGNLLRNPLAQLGLLVGPAAYDMVANRNAPTGDVAGDFLGLGEYGDFSGPQAPAPMPTPEMAINAAPPPMSMAMAPSMAGQIPTPMNPAPMAPAMAPAPMPAPAPAPAPMPAPMPAYVPPGGVWEGQNQGIGDDTRARAMEFVRKQMGLL